MEKIHKLLLVVIITFWIPVCCAAQNSSAKKSQAAETTNTPGPTAFAVALATGSRPHFGAIYNEGVGVGYNITKHFGGDVGASLYTVQSPFSIVTNRDWRWTTLLGDPFIDLRYTTKLHGLDMMSILTGTIPASSAEQVFTTGRFGVDWYNHIEAHYKGFAPFLNFGAANETMDRYVLPRPYNIARPYEAFGVNANFEGGLSYTIFKHYSVGGSAYAIVPFGSQKVFSRLVSPDSSVAGALTHNRYWYNAFETVGNSKIARDNGYSGWVEVARIKNLKVQVGLNYSVHYRLGTAFVMLKFDGTSLIRFLTATE